MALPVFYSVRYHIDIGPHVFPTQKYRLVRDRVLALPEAADGALTIHEPAPASWDELGLVHTAEYLAKHEIDVTHAQDGERGLALLGQKHFDVVLLDLMLPGIDGFEVCRRLRAAHGMLPVIMLTARGDEVDRVVGLELGADDYLAKPFSPRELLARIRAVLRRRAPQLSDEPTEIGGLQLDPATHRVAAKGRNLELGPTEFRLLRFLMTHPERVHSRSQLLDQVWGDHIFVEERTVDVHIRRLRKALEPTGHDRLIETVRGSGYRLSASALTPA